jgi:putative endonuclease
MHEAGKNSSNPAPEKNGSKKFFKHVDELRRQTQNLPAGRQVCRSQECAGSIPVPGTTRAKVLTTLAFSFSMFFVYAIKSLSRNYVYVGLTNNLDRRIKQHQSGLNETTVAYASFRIVLTKTFETQIKAMQRETFLKY